MQSTLVQKPTGADWLRQPIVKSAVIIFSALLGIAISKMGLMIGLALVGLPFVLFYVVSLMTNPNVGLISSIVMGFLSSGLSRYVNAPWGLTIDAFLFIAFLGVLFKKFRYTDWSPLKNDIFKLALIWMGFVMLELFNPEMRSAAAWFYAMRGVGLYQLLGFALTFMLYRKPSYLDSFLKIIVVFSLLGTVWGLRQMIFGTDEAENHWLYAEGYASTHILAGVLRVFSFYSDAGQFGSSQAMVALMSGIICLGPITFRERLFYGTAALITFVGFAISGTRGALAVPAAGAIVYLFVSRNFRLLAVGMIVIGVTFYFLKYTFVLQNVEQIRRMRTALNPEDPSLLVRLKNQVTFGNYLKTRPLGGGIGSAGYWGSRFTPGTLLASTATDSYYVKLWAETGIIGMCLHLYILGYFTGKGGNIVWHLRDPVLRSKISALFASMCGILLSSYGNQVFSQMPTGIIMSIAIPLIFISPQFDEKQPDL